MSHTQSQQVAEIYFTLAVVIAKSLARHATTTRVSRNMTQGPHLVTY